jgi:phosphatidylserine/phosphatidylglycerophosphate/cardiolipin synthase-like enzyme
VTLDDFQLHTRKQYFEELAALADKAQAGDRIAIATMSYEPADPFVGKLMISLQNAAGRGVHVLLLVDAYTFLVNEMTHVPGPLWLSPKLGTHMRQPFADRLNELNALRDHGGSYVITNMPKRAFSTIPAGRSHVKGAVVNDRLFLGGCNLYDANEIDIMAGWQDKKAADWLYSTFESMAQNGGSKAAFNGHDVALPLTNSMQILLDSGKPKQSIIYDHAMQLIDDAKKHIFLTCQFFPGGSTAQHLLAAHNRGVDVQIAYSPPSIHGKEAAAHHAYILRERTRLPASFFAGKLPRSAPRIHAKVIATDTGVIFGSHNYVTQGVTFGTAEIALLSHDPLLAQAIRSNILGQLKIH